MVASPVWSVVCRAPFASLVLLSACSNLVDSSGRLTDASLGDGDAEVLSGDGSADTVQQSADSGDSCTTCAMTGEHCSYNCRCCSGAGLPALTCIGLSPDGFCGTVGGP